MDIDAQLLWNLKLGGMKRTFTEYPSSWADNTNDRIDWQAGLELEIPINKKFNIETGLRYKDHFSMEECGDNSYTQHIELPVRFAYKLPLNKHFTLHAGVGPYASYMIRPNKYQFGIEPSIAIYWNCLSLGAQYNLICIDNGFKDINKPAIMLTLGVRFKTSTWKYIGAGLLTVATLGAATAMAWNNINSSSSSSYSNSSYSSYSSSTSSTNSNKYSISDQNNYNTDKKTWDQYDNYLSSHFFGSRSATRSDVEQWQRKMKELRNKWSSKGKSFPYSQNENASTSNCPNSSHSH